MATSYSAWQKVFRFYSRDAIRYLGRTDGEEYGLDPATIRETALRRFYDDVSYGAEGNWEDRSCTRRVARALVRNGSLNMRREILRLWWLSYNTKADCFDRADAALSGLDAIGLPVRMDLAERNRWAAETFPDPTEGGLGPAAY